MIARFIARYECNEGEFLAQEIRDRAVGDEKSLMAYLCMIMILFWAIGVQEIPRLDEMIDPANTTILGLIQNMTKSMARKDWRAEDMLFDIF